MSLATCCTSCGTVFRVVQDQLKVSEGWVRCGRCSEVFNALEGLFDLERDTAPAPLGPTPSGGDTTMGEASELGAASREQRSRASTYDPEPGSERQDPSLVERLGAELFPDRLGPGGKAEASSRFTALEQFEFDDLRIDAELLTDEAPISQPLDSAISLSDSEPAEPGPRAAPEFLRHADQHARWQRPGVRLLLSFMALLLLSALGLQVGHHFRDSIAARWPATTPLLAQWCGLVQCSLSPLRRIEDIAVESTTFSRAAGPDQFRIAVVLRNRGTLAVAAPSVDLSLTDASGSLLARKTLSPQDFRPSPTVLDPGSETQMQLVLAAGTPLVTGYTVEIFYP